jgi:hypothetical protein
LLKRMNKLEFCWIQNVERWKKIVSVFGIIASEQIREPRSILWAQQGVVMWWDSGGCDVMGQWRLWCDVTVAVVMWCDSGGWTSRRQIAGGSYVESSRLLSQEMNKRSYHSYKG